MRSTLHRTRKASLATAILTTTLGFFLMVSFVPSASANEQCTPVPDVTAPEDAPSEFCVILSNPVDVEINQVAQEDPVVSIHPGAELSYDVAGHTGNLDFVVLTVHPFTLCPAPSGDIFKITCDPGPGVPVELNVNPPESTGVCIWDASYRLTHSLGNHSGPLGPVVAPC